MDNALLIAVLLGWIMSVCLHEYAHALTAYLAGDESVRHRGYLSMNPLSFIDPVVSILIPLLALWMGGIPLPGGAVLIDRSALRKPWYGSLVSAAGPLANLLLFGILALVIHPKTGLIDYSGYYTTWSNWAVFAGTMALLQLMAILLNLLPIPPLDGFQIIEPFLKPTTRDKLLTPGTSMFGLISVFLAFRFVPGFSERFFGIIETVFHFLGIPSRIPFTCYQLTFH